MSFSQPIEESYKLFEMGVRHLRNESGLLEAVSGAIDVTRRGQHTLVHTDRDTQVGPVAVRILTQLGR